MTSEVQNIMLIGFVLFAGYVETVVVKLCIRNYFKEKREYLRSMLEMGATRTTEKEN